MKTKYKKQKKIEEFKLPSPKKLVKTGIALGVAGLGIHYLNKLSGGN